MVGVLETISVCISFLLGIAGTYAIFRKYKTAIFEGVDVVDAISKMLNDIKSAVEDDNVSKEEIQMIIQDGEKVIKEYNEFVNALKDLTK